MKQFIVVCAFIAVSSAMGGTLSGASAAGDAGMGSPCKEMHKVRGTAEDMSHRGPFAALIKVLRLSEEQQAKVRDILKADHEANSALMKKMAENRKLFMKKAHAATLDEAGLRALAGQQGQLMAQMIVSPAVVRNKIRALLTPEQRDLEERIQPLLEKGPEHRPHFCGDDFPPPMGMGMLHGPCLADMEMPPPPGNRHEDCPPCDEEE
ncbi:MAG TPA: Spy/CpxP family protein refolding chaperone [Geobacteraceae bacterium]|nr:Spy/CpxP family protein refolding chaperone [Geobacteraceae bacterium]